MSQGNQPDELTIVDGNLNNVRGWLMKPSTKGGIVAALGGYIDADEFINHVLIHIQSSAGSKNDLTMFSFAAQYQAIHACAVLGLLPGHQQVALIGQKNGKIRVMPQWQGLKALLERHPAVREVGKPMLVHAKDKIDWAGEGEDIRPVGHVFNPLDPNRKIEKIDDIQGGYVTIYMRDGSTRVHVVRQDYIKKCQSCAETQNVWQKWFEQQAMKTVLRSAYSRRVVPIDPMVQGRVEAFLKVEDDLLGNDPRLVVEPAATVQQAPRISRSAMLAEHMAPRQEQHQHQTMDAQASAGDHGTPPVADSPDEREAPAADTQESAPGAGDTQQQPAGDLSPMQQWEQMAATCKTEAALNKLLKHFNTLELKESELADIEMDHDQRVAAIRTKKQAPLLPS
jgi:recombinational DNA repair protein RecT